MWTKFPEVNDLPKWSATNEIGIAKGSPGGDGTGLTIVDSQTGNDVFIPQHCVREFLQSVKEISQGDDTWPIRIPR